ncbi:MAG: hypothetical protein LQ349_008489 [Xanthoria aureola]|nr:MAG: hypothetical protein LQ349_008489 [Xanthoria aureola]
MDQDLALRTPTTASPLKIQAYYHMLGLSSDSTREEVKAKCEALASMAATASGASESSVNQRLMAEVCATLGFPQDPHSSTDSQEEDDQVDAMSTAQEYLKPTMEELIAWAALIPLRDDESKHDEAFRKASGVKKETHGYGSGEIPNDDVEKKPTKADPKDSTADPISAIVGHLSKKRVPAFENWRRLRRDVSS